MTRRTLLDFFADVTSDAAAQNAAFLAYDAGYRTWPWTYGDLAAAARRFAQRLRDEGVAAGDAIAIWSENRPEWIAALWGALLEGVVVVPIDYRTSPDFLLKGAGIVDARVILVGDAVDASALGDARRIWSLPELSRSKPVGSNSPEAKPEPRASSLGPATTAEIIFTSGATAEPKGVVLTHKNILANIVPIEREMAKHT